MRIRIAVVAALGCMARLPDLAPAQKYPKLALRAPVGSPVPFWKS